MAMSVALVASLSGCGGGKSNASTTTTSSAVTGTVNLKLAGGASGGYSGVTFTVTGVALNTSATANWSATDSSWTVVTLASPVTVDLANLSNGASASVLSGAAVPVGTYRQIRLLVSSTAGTASYVDASNVTHTMPLEWPDALLGVRVPVTLTVSKGSATTYYLEWDVEHSLQPLASGAAMTLRPNLRAYDPMNSGAIQGVVDTSLFCGGTAHTGCIEHISVSAQTVSSDGSVHEVVRSTEVTTGTNAGAFLLFPLPSNTSFDVVLRGRNMVPMVVKAVPVSVSELLAGGTYLSLSSSGTIALSLATDASTSVSLTPSALTDARVWLGQTLSGDSVPYEWACSNADPFAGQLSGAAKVPNGSSIKVATYQSTLPQLFSTTSASEGATSYSVKAYGSSYDAASGVQVVAAPSGTAIRATRTSGLASGTLTVQVSAATPANYDQAQVVVSDVNGVVLTADASAHITAAGSVALTVPVGSTAAALGGTAVYSVSVRGWKATAPQTGTWARATSVVDLRSSTSGSVTLALP